jgi:hypothetical protein
LKKKIKIEDFPVFILEASQNRLSSLFFSVTKNTGFYISIRFFGRRFFLVDYYVNRKRAFYAKKRREILL